MPLARCRLRALALLSAVHEESRLAEPELIGAAILALGTDAVFLVDPATLGLLAVNRGFTRVLGYPSAEGLRLDAVLTSAPQGTDELVVELTRTGQAML